MLQFLTKWHGEIYSPVPDQLTSPGTFVVAPLHIFEYILYGEQHRIRTQKKLFEKHSNPRTNKKNTTGTLCNEIKKLRITSAVMATFEMRKKGAVVRGQGRGGRRDNAGGGKGGVGGE